MPDPRGQDSRKIRFIDKPGYKTMGVVMWLNVVRVAYPEVKVQVRDLVRVVGIVAPFDPRGGGSVPGKNYFYRVPGGKWAEETCAVCPEQRFATGVPGKVQDGTVWGL